MNDCVKKECVEASHRLLFLNNTHSKVRVKEEVKGSLFVRGENHLLRELTVSFSPSATTRVILMERGFWNSRLGGGTVPNKVLFFYHILL